MLKDMENNIELIEFASYLTGHDVITISQMYIDWKTNHSINSNEPDELRVVSKHEAKENICPVCKGSGKALNVKYDLPCQICSGLGQI